MSKIGYLTFFSETALQMFLFSMVVVANIWHHLGMVSNGEKILIWGKMKLLWIFVNKHFVKFLIFI